MTTGSPRDFREWMRMMERGLQQVRSTAPQLARAVTKEQVDELEKVVNADRERTPAAPVELTVESTIYLDPHSKFYRAAGIVDFADVTKATDGRDIEIEEYELWARKQGTTLWFHVGTNDDSAVTGRDFDPGSVMEFRVRAIGKYTVSPGEWSAAISATMTFDDVAPDQPTPPVVTASRGTLSVTWDGLAVTGPMPLDLDFVRLAMGEESSPTLEIHKFDGLGGVKVVTGLPYHKVYFFRLQAVDTSGNESPWSEQATGFVTPLVDTDIILEKIDAAQTDIQNADQILLESGEELGAKLAATGLAADNAVAAAGSAEALAGDAKEAAEAAELKAAAAVGDATTALSRATDAETAAEAAQALVTSAETAAQNSANSAADALTQAQAAAGDAGAAQTAANTAQAAADSAAAAAAAAGTDASEADAKAAQAAADAAQALADAAAAASSASTAASEAATAKTRADAAAADALAAFQSAEAAEGSASTASGAAAAAETAADTAAGDAAAALAQAQAAGTDAGAAQAAATAAQTAADTAKAEATAAGTAAANADAEAAQAAADAAQAVADAAAAASSAGTAATEAAAAKTRADSAAADAQAAYANAQAAETRANEAASSASAAETAADTAAGEAAAALAQAQAAGDNAGAAQTAADAAQTAADNAAAAAAAAGTDAAAADAAAAQAAADAAQAVADAAAAKSAAEAAEDKAASAVSTAQTAQADADAAAKTVDQMIRSGANLVLDPGVEEGRLAQYGGERSSDYAHRGAYSLKVTANGSIQDIRLTETLVTSPGRIYYGEVWVRTDSTDWVGTVNLATSVYRVDGTQTWPSFSSGSTLQPGTGQEWTKLAGYVTMPSDADKFYPRISVRNDVPVGTVFYWDDFVIVDATEAKAAIDAAAAAQSKADEAHTLAGTAESNAQAAINSASAAASAAQAAQGVADEAEKAARAAMAQSEDFIKDPQFTTGADDVKALEENASDPTAGELPNRATTYGRVTSNDNWTNATKIRTVPGHTYRLEVDAKPAHDNTRHGAFMDLMVWYLTTDGATTNSYLRAGNIIPDTVTEWTHGMWEWTAPEDGSWPVFRPALRADGNPWLVTNFHVRDVTDLKTLEAAASAAASAAEDAQATADNLPKVLHGTGAPAGTAPDGSIWWQHEGSVSGHVTAQWNRVGGNWVSTPIDSKAIANLDVGKLTAGAAEMDEGVINRLFTDVVRARMAQADEFIGENAILTDSVTAPKIRASEEMSAKLAQFLKVQAGMIEANAVEADNIAAGAVQAEHLALGSVPRNALQLGGDELIIDPMFMDPATPSRLKYQGLTDNIDLADSAWTYFDTAPYRSQSRYLGIDGTHPNAVPWCRVILIERMTVSPGEKFYMHWVTRNNAADFEIRYSLQMLYADGSPRTSLEMQRYPHLDAQNAYLSAGQVVTIPDGVEAIEVQISTRSTEPTYGWYSVHEVSLRRVMASNDPGGPSAELSPSGMRLYNADGNSIVNLSSTPPHHLQILDSGGGETLISLDDEGQINARDLSVVSDPRFMGRPMIGKMVNYESPAIFEGNGWLDIPPRGLVAWGLTSGKHNSTFDNREWALMELEFPYEGDRTYRITVEPITLRCVAGKTILMQMRYTTDGSRPTLDSVIGRRWKAYNGSDAVVGFPMGGSYIYGYGQAPSGTTRLLLTIQSDGWAATDQDYRTGATRVLVEDIGLAVAETGVNRYDSRGSSNYEPTPPPTKKSYTQTWESTGTRSYLGTGGEYQYNTSKMYQGNSGYTSGDASAVADFGNGSLGESITAALSGATIGSIEVYLYFDHWWYNSGGTTDIVGYNGTSLPSSRPTMSTIVSGVHFGIGQGKWVNVPSSRFDEFKGGTFDGIGIRGYGLAEYGFAQGGGSSSRRPKIRIKYTK